MTARRREGETLADFRRRLARNERAKRLYRRKTRGERMVQFAVSDAEIEFLLDRKLCTEQQIQTKAGLSEVVRRRFSHALDR